MKQWQKLIREVTRTPGPIRVQLFLLTTLTASSVLSTGLQISKAVGNTSGENISGRNESLEVAVGKLHLKVTGKNTMGAVLNLLQIENYLETQPSREKSFLSTKQVDGSIMRRPSNSF